MSIKYVLRVFVSLAFGIQCSLNGLFWLLRYDHPNKGFSSAQLQRSTDIVATLPRNEKESQRFVRGTSLVSKNSETGSYTKSGSVGMEVKFPGSPTLDDEQTHIEVAESIAVLDGTLTLTLANSSIVDLPKELSLARNLPASIAAANSEQAPIKRTPIQGDLSARGRSTRFPSIEKRVELYMGDWYVPDSCLDAVKGTILFERNDEDRSVSFQRSTTGKAVETTSVGTKPSSQSTFAIDFFAIRQQAEYQNTSAEDKSATQDVANALCSSVDMQAWKYNPVAAPLLVRIGADGKYSSSSHNLPHLRAIRRSQKHETTRLQIAESGACSTLLSHFPTLDNVAVNDDVSPIIWNFRLQEKRMKQTILNIDTDWSKKRNQTLSRQHFVDKDEETIGSENVPGATESDFAARCRRRPVCRLVLDSADSKLVKAMLVGSHSMPDTIGNVRINAPALTKRKELESKALVIMPSNTLDLASALLSKSVVMMPPATTTSWLMEDLLEPWVHYIPLESDLSNVEQRTQWVVEHDHEAETIAKQATLWMEDLMFGKEAANDNEAVEQLILRRYSALFRPQGSSEASVNRMVKSQISTSHSALTAGNRSIHALIEGSKRTAMVDSDADVTTAICHKTLFGAVDLYRFIQWAAYNHMLGFDRIFAWYLPSIRNYEGFDLLASLPYVTMIENVEGVVREVRPGLEIVVGDGDQLALEKTCLKGVAKDYDWVLFADADEYLWFNQNIGVKEFLHGNSGNNTYLSFGKYMYTRSHGVNASDNGFGLDAYPFTTGRYCFAKPSYAPEKRALYLGDPVCPRHFGRSKVMVKPAFHDKVNIHGTHIPNPEQRSVHFHSDVAHFKEWPDIFSKVDPILREKKSFTVEADSGLTVHHSLDRAQKANPDGTYNVFYDDKLSNWLRFVATRQGG
jgi:hypothetical protein